MAEYKYDKIYKGILIKSNFELTDEVCEEYIDDFLKYDKNSRGQQKILFIDDPELIHGKEIDNEIQNAKTVGELINALAKLPHDTKFEESYGCLGIDRGWVHAHFKRHLRTKLSNDEPGLNKNI